MTSVDDQGRIDCPALVDDLMEGYADREPWDEDPCASYPEDGYEGEEEPYEPPHNLDLGRRGEEAAARFLVRRGYEIIERNWKCKAGEADIIARDDTCLVFVEVKTRMDEDQGVPEEAVDEAKRKRYERIAASFLKTYEEVDIQVRFDVIGILVLTPNRAMIRHHINAFGVM